ncbi:ArgE/DapE family deacylase [Candidatus Microgenomates bacterium]|nr:ArgE/DapE family deacylase [Candidatus Microgenomates bacterium]MBI2622210.1 ArgE/DapE family deacylase [Candidatus Microgenomates bacterium]
MSDKQIIETADFNEAVKMLKKLVSVNTVNPPGNELSLQPIIKEAFDGLGAKMEIWEKKKGRANFIGKIGNGNPIVGFFPHLDTVPAGDGWKTDPFKPVVKNGRLYGRGSIDSKGNFVSSWLAIKTFLALNKKFKGTIYLVGCADEELGSEFGVKYLLEKGFKVDYAIVPDGGSIDKIIIGEKGALRLRIKSFGKQAHGSTPERGINAIEHLIKLLHKINEIRFDQLKFHELFTPVTKNIGVIKGGHAVNIVPAYAEAEIDFRLPLGVNKRNVIDKIQQKVAGLEKEVKIEIEEFWSAEPHLTNVDSPLIQAFLASVREAGLKMRVGTMGGITDAKSLSGVGIDTLVHCLDDGSHGAHNANEYVLLENIKIAANLYRLTLEKIFQVK